LKANKSCNLKPKIEISKWTVQFAISVFDFEVQDLSIFKFLFFWAKKQGVDAVRGLFIHTQSENVGGLSGDHTNGTSVSKYCMDRIFR